MTKLTEMINLKAVVTGTIFFSTLSLIASSSAHAFFSFGGNSEDDGITQVDFNLELTEAQQFETGFYPDAVSNFIHNNETAGGRALISSSSGTKFDLIIGNCCNIPNPLTIGSEFIRQSVVDRNNYPDPSPEDDFNNYFDNVNSRAFLQYTINISNASTEFVDFLTDTPSPFPGFDKVDGSFSFVVPRSLNSNPFGVSGLVRENKETIGYFNYTTVNDADESFQDVLEQFEVVAFDVNGSPTPEKVFEPGTSLSLLALGSLGAMIFWKHRVKN